MFRLDEFAETLFRGREIVTEELDLLRDIIPLAKQIYRSGNAPSYRRHDERGRTNTTAGVDHDEVERPAHPLLTCTSTFINSRAAAAFGSKQVGYAYGFMPSSGNPISVINNNPVDNNHRIMLWSGTALSAVDLHPQGFKSSEAFGLSDSLQVGYGTTTDGSRHAIMWSGSAASAIDLNSLFVALNSNFVGSDATGISADGSIVGNAYDADGNTYAILLAAVSVPELASSGLFVLGLGIGSTVFTCRRVAYSRRSCIQRDFAQRLTQRIGQDMPER